MNYLVISHLTLRRLVGIAGVLLPLVLWSVGDNRDSISNHYYGPMRDYLVASMVAIGAFLLAYNGYDWRDKIAGRVAGVTAIFIGMVPHQGPYAHVHFISAVIFLATLAYMSYYLFTLGDRYPTRRKPWRNAIYRICGVLIIVGLVGAVDGVVFDRPVFWWEAISVLSFGISWLVKGETVLWD